jgi:hypothetical protein
MDSLMTGSAGLIENLLKAIRKFPTPKKVHPLIFKIRGYAFMIRDCVAINLK